MNYRDINALNDDLINWLPSLPKDIDLIVGIPRSGLLAANLLSLYLNLPMTDVDGLICGKIISGGERLRSNITSIIDKNLKVLIVDDSLWSGSQMNFTRDRIKRAGLKHTIEYAAVYVTPGSENKIDYFYELLPVPRIFQWNVMQHDILEASCVDIDGVLCLDPTEEQNDDGEKYIEFLQNAKALWRPTVKIGWLVTCRLEKYRKITEKWLSSNNIQYGELIMMNLLSKEDRIKYGHSRYKAEIYKQKNAALFYESSQKQAEKILEISGKPVFCVSSMKMLIPNEFVTKRGIKSWIEKRLPPKMYSFLSSTYQNCMEASQRNDKRQGRL